MRFAISSEQLKFFHLQGFLELETIISREEADRLISAITSLRANSPGYPDENCFRSIPLIATLARKNGWGQLASDLIHKKPLRIAYDHFWEKLPESLPSMDDES